MSEKKVSDDDCMRFVENVRVELLRPHSANPRTHSLKQIRQIATSIRKFGFLNPILIDPENRILAGHGRLAAAKQLGMETVPTVCVEGLTEAQARAYLSCEAGPAQPFRDADGCFGVTDRALELAVRCQRRCDGIAK